MKKRAPLNKKLVIELFITILFFIGSLLYIGKKELRTDLRLEVLLKTPHADKFQLHIDQKKPLALDIVPSRSGDFQPLVFPLPPGKIKDLKLTLGEKDGTVTLAKVTLKSLLKSYEWTGRNTRKLVDRMHHVGKSRVRGEHLQLTKTGNEAFLIFNDNFCRFIDDAGRDKTFYYILSPFLSLLFFYLVHFFNPRGLLIFFDRRIFVNMSLIFLLLLLLPIMDGLFHVIPESPLVEKRKIAGKPELRFDSLSDYPDLYTSYYNDHFSGRGHLIFWNNFLEYKLFGLSAIPKVLVGKEGWLFLGQTVVRSGTIDYFRNFSPFTDEDLEQWKELFEQRYKWLDARDIRYMVVIAPNKNTIYPEFMPGNIRKAHSYSRLDQLIDYLDTFSSVHLVDLRPVLLEAKKQRPVYSRTDTHWNDYGAYIAYREIMRHISRYFKEAQPIPLSQYSINTVNSAGGDLAQMLSLHLDVMREDKIELRPRFSPQARGGNLENLAAFVRRSYRERANAPLPNIIMVHDSFYQKLRPFLSEHFSRILYIWDWNMNFYPSVIESEKPVLVIDEMAERFLYSRD